MLQERREKRWPNTEDIITENEQIITENEEVEIERMLVDTNKTGTKKIWNDGAKTWKKHEGATATVFTEDTLGY